MHKLVVTIAHKTFTAKLGRIISINPQVIPRVGDRIDMQITPAPKVADVVWNYDNPNQTNVYVWVE
jgi:hypothetical protein